MSRFQDLNPCIVGDANFYMEEGQAYTEDNVLVYNLFISGVPQCITEEQLAAFFGQFGEILQIRLTGTEGEGAPTQTGFVNFKDAKSAAKVLELKERKIQEKSFRVKACDTWHQPLPRALFPPEVASPLGVYKKRRRVTVDSGPAAIPSIDGVQLTDLNDDCLEHILKFLDMRDQLNFARVSQRLRGIVEMLYKTQYRVMELGRLPIQTIWEMREFVMLTGPHVEVLRARMCSSRSSYILQFIIKYVGDLKKLEFYNFKKEYNDSLRKMVRKFVSLKELSLVRFAVDDLTLDIISRMPNLESLQLKFCTSPVGENLKLFSRLKELSLSACAIVHPDHFIAMCAASTELRSLDISYSSFTDEKLIRQIVQHCTKLETLNISIRDFPVDVVATLPNLKRLEIQECIKIQESVEYYLESMCHALATHRANQLEELVIRLTRSYFIFHEAAESIGKLKKLRLLELTYIGVDDQALCHFHSLESLLHIGLWYCHLLTDDSVLHWLGSCKTLRSVKIIHCRSLSDNFYESASEMLRSQGRKVKKDGRSFSAGKYVFSIEDC